MDDRDVVGRRPVSFLGLVLVCSVPFWFLAVATGGRTFVLGLPASVLMIFVPAAVAIGLTLPEAGRRGVRRLWAGVLDPRSVRPRWWWLIGIGAPMVAYAIGWLLGARPTSDAEVTSWHWLPALFVIYFLGAIPEELGWSRYATAPLVQRWGVLGAGLAIGSVWEVWHWVPRIAMGASASWLVGGLVLSVASRTLMVLMYARGGGSLALACGFHAMLNATPSVMMGFAGAHPWLIVPGMILMVAIASVARKVPSRV